VTAAELVARKASEISIAYCEYWWIVRAGRAPALLSHAPRFISVHDVFDRRKPEVKRCVMRKMTNSENASEVLTLAEAAGALRVSQRHLFQILADGNGPPVISLGRRKVIRREALQQWLLNQEVASDAAR
jgi:predicted DNA-binding transcriptional regulator AlpA